MKYVLNYQGIRGGHCILLDVKFLAAIWLLPKGIIMKSSFRETLKTICLSLVFLLPLATHAKPSGEIIFRHPTEQRELWIGNVNDEQSARPIFRLPHVITAFSIQKDGRYIVAVSR